MFRLVVVNLICFQTNMLKNVKTGMLGLCAFAIMSCAYAFSFGEDHSKSWPILIATGSLDEVRDLLKEAESEKLVDYRFQTAQRNLMFPAVVSVAPTEIIAELHRLGVEVNFQDADGESVLEFAINTKNEAAVQQLIKLGADPDLVGRFGNSPRRLCDETEVQLRKYTACDAFDEALE